MQVGLVHIKTDRYPTEQRLQTVRLTSRRRHKMGSSSPEPLLPGCVPELQLDTNPRLHLQEVHIEVNTHRLVYGLQEQVFSVALQQRGLAHCGVPQHDDPELVLPQSQVHCRW